MSGSGPTERVAAGGPLIADLLTGVRVIDASGSVAGAVSTMLLADLGADVVSLEPVLGDRTNDNPGFVRWLYGKRLERLDLDAPQGVADLGGLLDGADLVVVAGSQPRLAARGLDAAAVARRNPRAVHLWLPHYGEHGTGSGFEENATLLAALTSLADQQPATEEIPVIPVVPVVHYIQGGLGAVSAVAGLLRRNRTGLGGSVAVSGMHAVGQLLGAGLLHADNIVRPSSRLVRNSSPNYRPYVCGDGRWLFLGALTPPFFFSALDTLELLDVMVAPGVDGEFVNLLRAEFAGPASQRLAEKFATKGRDEWIDILTAANVPCAPILQREEWLDSEVVAHLGLLERIDDPAVGPAGVPGRVMTMSPRYGGDLDASRRPVVADIAPDDAPLTGVRVLDLGNFIAGPLAPRLMADLGADVVKVENPDGDPYRIYSVSFVAFNQEKRGLALDLKHPEGRAALLRMAADADVVLDNVRPQVRRRLGVHDSALREVNPNVVRCTITAWGDNSPLAETPGFDPLVQARSGFMAVQGGDDDPVFSVMPVHDIACGTLSALGVLAALFDRDRHGTGREVTVSLSSASLLVQSGEFVRYPGRPAAAVGGQDWPGPSDHERVVECADGWIAYAAEDSMAPALDALDPLRTFASITRAEALLRLGSVGIPAVVVVGRFEPFVPGGHPWFEENQVFSRIDDPTLGRCTVVAGASSWSVSRRRPPAGAPTIGQHSREVLGEYGFAPAEIDALIASGAAR